MNKQQGFTLIELMIASLIGLIIMGGMMNLFITTNRSVALSDALSQNQETGRFAMDYLTKYIRLAGYSEDFTIDSPPLFLQAGVCTAGIETAEPKVEYACSENNPNTGPKPEDRTVLGDRLAIPFVASGDAGAETRSCSGLVVGGIANGQQSLVNVFWVDNDSGEEDSLLNSYRELRCRTYSRDNNAWLDPSSVSLITNVEGFEFQVGIAADNTSKFASTYVNITKLQAGALSDGTLIDMNNVRSIRIALLTTSMDSLDDKKLQSNKRKRIFGVLDAPHDTYTFTDGSLRNIFSNTIELPNMIEGSGSN